MVHGVMTFSKLLTVLGHLELLIATASRVTAAELRANIRPPRDWLAIGDGSITASAIASCYKC